MPGTLIRRGDRVTLRTLEREDLEFVQRASTEPSIRHPLGSVVRNREDVETAYEEDDGQRLLVCLDGPDAGPRPDACNPDADPTPGTTRPIGLVTVGAVDWKRPELSFWLVPEVHGEGYGTESVGLAVDYTFQTRAVPAVAAGAYDFNDASRALLESLGFECEGRLRRHSFTDGAWHDLLKYGLLREEWDERDA